MAIQYSSFLKGQILALKKQGVSYREISKEIGCSHTTAMRICEKFFVNGTIEHEKGNGRKLKFSDEIVNQILNSVKKNNALSYRKLSKLISKEIDIDLKKSTLSNILKSKGYRSVKKIKKPFLTKKHMQRRFQTCQDFLFMSLEERKKIIFSDEKRFFLNGNDSRGNIILDKNSIFKDKIVPTFKQPRSVMVWACFSYYGTGKLVFVENTMKAVDYVTILSNNLKSSASKMNLNNFSFQQDNAPPHKANLTLNFFRKHEISYLDWPAQSPDINPIENLWDIVDRRVQERAPKTLEDLKKFIQIEWDNLTQELCQNLSNSFEKRIKLVIKENGGSINY